MKTGKSSEYIIDIEKAVRLSQLDFSMSLLNAMELLKQYYYFSWCFKFQTCGLLFIYLSFLTIYVLWSNDKCFYKFYKIKIILYRQQVAMNLAMLTMVCF